MTFARVGAFCVFAILAVASSGCERFSDKVDPAYEALVERRAKAKGGGELGPGDKFSITVFHEPEMGGEFTVSPQGTISYPYVGGVEVAGKTCSDIELEITNRLKEGYLANPTVSCSIVEYNSKLVYILGAVKEPGAYPYRANSTVIEAVARAGGFTVQADRNRIRLKCQLEGEETQVVVPFQSIVDGLQPNINLMPGDVIFVPKSAFE